METMTAERAVASVQSQAEKIKSDAPQRVETMSHGDTWRQGDLYITSIPGVPKGAVKMKAPRLQLAQGETQGSRHILASAKGVTMYDPPDRTALDGPIMELAGRTTVEHPEHGDVSLPPGCYAVTYQRAFGDELRAQRD